MQKIKAKAKEVSTEMFNEINQLLIKYGIDGVEAAGLKIHLINPAEINCPHDKEKYCWIDVEGNMRCRCI